MAIISFSYRIEGLVQGVFYRATTQREAQRLGLTGFARNEPDGSVYVIACGEPEILEVFEVWLWKGPVNARVTNITKAPNDLLIHFTNFDVED